MGFNQPQIEKTTAEGEMCVHKWVVSAILGTLSVLILVQAFVIGKYMYTRIFFATVSSSLK